MARYPKGSSNKASVISGPDSASAVSKAAAVPSVPAAHAAQILNPTGPDYPPDDAVEAPRVAPPVDNAPAQRAAAIINPGYPEDPLPDAPVAEKANVGELSIATRYHEPFKAYVWDVSYTLKGRHYTDSNFRSGELAEQHAVLIRDSYGLK